MKPTFHQDDMQTSVAAAFTLAGVGVHSGRYTKMTIRPAPADTGILFHRTDVAGEEGHILAHASNAIETQLCTRIENRFGVGINMIEHVMAAFHGLGVDNAIVEIDSSEVPILDGSSLQVVERILQVGIARLHTERRYIEVLAPVSAQLENGAWAQLSPADQLTIDIDIDFDDPGIGQQRCQFDMTQDDFVTELSSARTFCMLKDVEKMRNAGLAKGGSMDNALVYDNGRILNEGGLRMSNECVRHKALDCMGDLYLLGMPVKAKLSSHMPGHRLSTILVRALLEAPDCFRIVGGDEGLQVASATSIPALAVAQSA